MSDTVFLIDGYSYMYQSFFGGRRDLAAPDGTPTSVSYGFALLLNMLREKERAWAVVVAFDTPEPTFRHRVYPEYKAKRDKMPEDLASQIDWVRKIAEANRIPVVERDGVESDDIIATIAKESASNGKQVRIVSRDKDLYQVLSENTLVFDPRDRSVFGPEDVVAKWGVAPGQVVDFRALIGDTSDNIPGVHGIGEKTAVKLFEQASSLDEIYERLDDIASGKVVEKLRNGKDDAYKCRDLIALKTDVDVPPLNELALKEPDAEALAQIYNRLGMKELLIALAETSETSADLWASVGENEAPLAKYGRRDYRTIDTETALDDLVKILQKKDVIAVDTENTGCTEGSEDFHIAGISFADEEGSAYYVVLDGPPGSKTIGAEIALDRLRPVLEGADIAKIGQNLKYDIGVFEYAGIELKGRLFDTMVAAYLLEPAVGRLNIDALAERYLGLPKIPTTAVLGGTKKKPGRDMNEAPVSEVSEYSCEDSDVAYRLAGKLGPMLADEGLLDLFENVEMPLVEVLARMESEGIGLDVPYLEKMSGEFESMIARIEREIYDTAGEEFNIASPKQLGTILFDRLGLPVVKRTKTGPSTDASVLLQLSAAHEFPILVVRYRELAKLKSTYIDALPELVAPETGRLHTSFNQAVTATGRLSSSNPNLQNIPIRTEEGRSIRKAFVANDEDSLLVSADYSQIELRVIAHYSGDAALIKAFAGDADIHAYVAHRIFDVPVDKVSFEERHIAKTVNFSVVYGKTPFGLGRDLGIPIGEAKRFIEDYFERFSGVKEFINRTIDEARGKEEVRTILGRRRKLPNINSRNRNLRSEAERMAVNTVIQGSAADLIKLAMIRLDGRIRNEGRPSRILLQIHDELVVNVPADRLEEEKAMIVEEMVDACSILDVPVRVTVGAGRNWLEAGKG